MQCSKGHLFAFQRNAAGKPQLFEFDPNHQPIRAIGDDVIGHQNKTHGMAIDADDNIWICDENEQPHWVTPLATTTPRLEQAVRYDVLWQQARPGAPYTENYGNSTGLELIPLDKVETSRGSRLRVPKPILNGLHHEYRLAQEAA